MNYTFANLRAAAMEERLAQLQYILTLQNPWLAVGDPMDSASGTFLNGRESKDVNATTISSFNKRITLAEFNGHPWIRLSDSVKDYNYLHVRTVNVSSPFDNRLGEMLDAKIEHAFSLSALNIQIPITQDIIDQTSFIVIQVGFSK